MLSLLHTRQVVQVEKYISYEHTKSVQLKRLCRMLGRHCITFQEVVPRDRFVCRALGYRGEIQNNLQLCEYQVFTQTI